MDTFEFYASKIKCGGCVSNVTKGLKEINGVTEINVDIPTNVVSVSGVNLDKTEIEKKLAELGYPVV